MLLAIDLFYPRSGVPSSLVNVVELLEASLNDPHEEIGRLLETILSDIQPNGRREQLVPRRHADLYYEVLKETWKTEPTWRATEDDLLGSLEALFVGNRELRLVWFGDDPSVDTTS